MMDVPNRVSDDVWRAVETAVAHGVDPEQFMKEVRACYSQAYDDKKKYAMEFFNRMYR
jgi:hypothetical protein